LFQRFFGIIRQAGAQNDHPNLPTFLQLYNLICAYKFIKPPRFGNCRVTEEPVISISKEDFDEIFKAEKPEKAIEKLRRKIDGLVVENKWEVEDVLDHDYSKASVMNCVIYYMIGSLCRKFLKFVKCETCKVAFESFESERAKSHSELINLKSKGFLIYPNNHLYKLLLNVEEILMKNIKSPKCYEDTLDTALDTLIFTFPCELHKDDIMTSVLHNFISMRIRQYFRFYNRNLPKLNQQKKKNSHHVDS
jgi:hypothetical protein